MPLRPRRSRKLLATVVTAGLLMTGLGACSRSPTTTHTNAAGQEVTLGWKDYPAHAGNDAATILMAPVKEDAEAVGEQLLLAITDSLATDFGLSFTAASSGGWHPTEGNGFGGKSMTTTYNSARWASDTIPPDAADWMRIVATISKHTTAAGLGQVALNQDRPRFGTGIEEKKELIERFGSTDPNQFYIWFGTAYGASQWLSVDLHDVQRDPSGKAAQEYEELGLPGQQIILDYGATTISRDQVAAFKAALAPYARLEKPAATTSD